MYERILVGTDGSATASKAVARAVEVAKAQGARLTILSAGKAARTGPALAAAEAAYAGSGVTIDTKAVEGDAVEALVKEAKGYDLLVTGNKGMTGITRFLKGSVPNKVAHHLPCALLIVKTT